MIPVRAYFRLLVDYLRPMRGRVVLLSVVLLTSIGLQLLNPQIVRVFLDRVTEGATQDELIPLAIWFIGIAVVHLPGKTGVAHRLVVIATGRKVPREQELGLGIAGIALDCQKTCLDRLQGLLGTLPDLGDVKPITG